MSVVCSCSECTNATLSVPDKYIQFKQINELHSKIQLMMEDESNQVIDFMMFGLVRQCLNYYDIDRMEYKKYIEYSNGNIDKFMKKDKNMFNECIFQIVSNTIRICDRL